MEETSRAQFEIRYCFPFYFSNFTFHRFDLRLAHHDAAENVVNR